MSSWALNRLDQKFSTDTHKLCREINASLKAIKQQVIKFTTGLFYSLKSQPNPCIGDAEEKVFLFLNNNRVSYLI